MRRGIATALVAGVIACDDARPDFESLPSGYPSSEAPRVVDAGTHAIDAGLYSVAVDGPREARCGETVTRTAKIRNDGDRDAPFEARLLIDAAPPDVRTGVVPARSVMEISVPYAVDRPGKRGYLGLRVGDSYLDADLSVIAHGTYLSVYPTEVDFGDVGPMMTASPIDVYWTNLGDEPLEILALDGVASGVEVDEAPFPRTISRADFGHATLRMQSGPAGSNVAATVAPRLGNVTHCGPIPTLVVRGARVAEGTPTVTPLTLSYPPAPCWSKPLEAQIRIGNRTATPLAFAAFVGGGMFETAKRSGVIAPGIDESLPITYDRGGLGPIPESLLHTFDIDLRSAPPSMDNRVRTVKVWSAVLESCPVPP